MNCKHVEELLPLFVGRDLEEKRAMLVLTHMRSCTECARSAREHSEANQLLQLFEPPQFTEATYTTVRSHVLREIERESSAPQSIFALEFLRRSFQPRLMWAVSTAVLLAVCVFAYYFVAHQTNMPQDQKANADIKPAPAGTAGVPPALATGSPNPQLNLTTQHDPAAPSPAGVSDSPALGTSRRKPRFNLTASAPRSSTTAGGTSAVPVESARYSAAESKSFNTSVTSDKTLRLEIQTSDRNIRIIWFSHPRTNEGSPNESSKGI